MRHQVRPQENLRSVPAIPGIPLPQRYREMSGHKNIPQKPHLPTPASHHTAAPHRSASILSTKSICKNFNANDDRLHQIFPKQFRQKFFPEFSQKIFPAHATPTQSAIFPKCRIASFARIPASNHLMQPTLKNIRSKIPAFTKSFIKFNVLHNV